MKIKTNKKILLGIIALPASGSSIIAKMFHSIENAFCIMEPFHSNYAEKINFINLPKVGFLPKSNKDNLIKNIDNYLKNSIYDLGSIKEVQISTDGNKRWEYLIENDLITHYLFIYREPKSCWSSWKKKEFSRSGLEGFVKTYEDMNNHRISLLNKNKNVLTIKYEDIENKTLNDIFEGKLELKGELYINSDRFNTPINPIASNTNKIIKINKTHQNLSDYEKSFIDEKILKIYDEL